MIWSTVIPFATLAFLLVISPGPNGVLIAKTVPTSGRNAGFANIAGFVTAFYIHGLFSILGLSVILVQSATAFLIVKFLGAAYLIWIGVKALMAAFNKNDFANAAAPAKRKRTLVKAYLEGFLTNLLNPKTSIFYLAAFPQFITVGESNIGLFFTLVSTHALLNVVWFSGMIFAIGYFTNGTPKQIFKRWLNGATGIIFIAFGLKLATFKV